MSVTITQAVADAIAAAVVAQATGTATNKLLLKNGATTIASATDVAISATNNVISLTTASGLSVSATNNADTFELTDSSDTTLISGTNDGSGTLALGDENSSAFIEITGGLSLTSGTSLSSSSFSITIPLSVSSTN